MADNKDVINCPACDKPMTKVYMQGADVSVDVCLDGCGGMLFDNRELEKFDEEHENIDEIADVIQGKTFENVNEAEVRICPICKVPMVKQGSGKAGVQIDVCNTCGAKFLDNGELKKIRTFDDVSTNKAEALIDALYNKNLEDVLGENAHKDIKPSPRRKFFEKLVFNRLIK
jgi:Zn-finger nucleic acid-binding protein